MSETLWGVVIGALAAIAGGIIGELLKFLLETLRFRRDKKVEAYESIYKFSEPGRFESMITGDFESMDMLSFAKVFEDSNAKVRLYASKTVKRLYVQITDLLKPGNADRDKLDRFLELNNLLIIQMRKELKIKN